MYDFNMKPGRGQTESYINIFMQTLLFVIILTPKGKKKYRSHGDKFSRSSNIALFGGVHSMKLNCK